ncbi:MAG: ABC transporter permease subunit [Actinomycetota bacterium]
MADLGMPVARRGWVDRRRARLGWLIGLVLYTVMILAVWPSLEGSADFAELAEDYPEAIKAMFGGNEAFETITTPVGFLNSYIFAFMLPLLLAVMAIGLGAALLGEEHEDGLLDLLLAQPVTRNRVVVDKAVVVVAQVVVITVPVIILILLAGPAVDLDAPIGGTVAAALGTVLYGVLHGLVALLGGAVAGRRAAAITAGAVVAVAGYLFSTISELASWAEPLRYLSPLHHATAGNPVANGMPANYLVLLGAVVAALVASVLVFDRKDIT